MFPHAFARSGFPVRLDETVTVMTTKETAKLRARLVGDFHQ
jgi:hypothetical protein